MGLLKQVFRRAGTLLDLKSTVYADNIVTFTDYNAAKGEIISINGQKAWVFALYNTFSKAALLSPTPTTNLPSFSIEKSDQIVPLKADPGQILSPFEAGGYNLIELLHTKPSYVSSQSSSQLYTGYSQIDLAQPVSYGQNILCIGESNTGKMQVALSTAQQFIQNENHYAVFAMPNPAKRTDELLQTLPHERTFVYGTKTGSSDVAQYFVSYSALACAIALQQQNKHVLLVLDDILHHAMLEKSLFAYEKIIHSHLSSLTYDHSKDQHTSSISSMVLLDNHKTDITHSLIVMGLEAHLRSLASRCLVFEATAHNSVPLVDIMRFDQFPAKYHLPIFKALHSNLRQIFAELKEMQALEELRSKLGVYTDPWDKYLLLDSEYFLKVLNHSMPMQPWEQVLFLQFMIYTIKEEMASMVSLEPQSFLKSFLKFINKSKAPSTTLLKNKLASQDADILARIDKEISEEFYDSLKKEGLLKSYKDDYHEVAHAAIGSPVEGLPRHKGPETKTVIQGTMEKILK